MKLCMNEMMYCLKHGGGFPDTELVTGGAVGMAESQGETDSIGRLAGADQILDNEDLGWLMISTKWHEQKIIDLTGQNWRDPYVNAKLARSVFLEFVGKPGGGWSAWAAFNNKSFEKWLPMARSASSHLWAPSPTGDYMVQMRDLATK